MPYLPEPKQLTGFETTDGKVFDNIMEARKHQNEVSFLEFVRTIGFPPTEEEFIDWINEHTDRIEEYLYCKSGHDPRYINED